MPRPYITERNRFILTAAALCLTVGAMFGLTVWKALN